MMISNAHEAEFRGPSALTRGRGPRRARHGLLAGAALTLLGAIGPGSGLASDTACGPARGTGDLGLVIERESGSVLVVEHSANSVLGRIEGLGDLSHASAVFSRDQRHAFVFGRDGGLSRIDLLCQRLAARTVQAGNSIGGAISQDGRIVAVSNYQPGGVRLFDAASLELLRDVPSASDGNRSKVVGLVDAPGNRFVFSLYDSGEIWLLDPDHEPQRFRAVGRQPYDALIDPQGRYYIAGLFGEDGMALLDLWHPQRGVRRILDGYGRGQQPLPVYKMPHLEGWAMAGRLALVPAVGHHQALVIDTTTWQEVQRIDLAGQPVFVMARPDGRTAWVNFALPHNDTVQVIDLDSLRVVHTLRPGPGVLHMEFTPRGEHVWVSVRDQDRIDVYDTQSYERIATLPARRPSGIFFTGRAHRIGL